ncbi:MAG TPA: DNA-3-methyladenine glycosylase [Chthoniobacteraceae bacterium]|nr:DNA-3-methyladenine glycosylase [Chthoniobacteraceae bacterium]
MDDTRRRLGKAFFRQDPLVCARELIGCRFHWGPFLTRVVETEAYDAHGDEACHTFFRPSARAFVEAHPAGTAYVYFNYGVHWLFNVLVKGHRDGFVLFRALEPLHGLEMMRKARGKADPTHLCSGPGKLTQALGITGAHHGFDLCADPAHRFDAAGEAAVSVEASPRIGISRAVDLPWRFSLAGSPHVSGGRGRKNG